MANPTPSPPPAPAPAKPKSFGTSASAVAEDLVLSLVHARDCVQALIDQSRADGGKEPRDGTAAAGFVIGALVEIGAILPGQALHALRWALDGPRSDAADPQRNIAAAAAAAIVFDALEHGRKKTPNAVEGMRRASDVWRKHRVWRTAQAQIESMDRADASRRQEDHRAAHEKRLAAQHRGRAIVPSADPDNVPDLVEIPDDKLPEDDPPVS